MIYLFNVSKDDGFCTIVADSITIYNVKIDSLKLIASINCFWMDEKVEDNGIFRDYQRKKEESVKRWTYSDITVQEVLRHFD